MSSDSVEANSSLPAQKDFSVEETLANSWSSAFNKVCDDGALTYGDINGALIDDAYLGGKTFTRDERIALKHMKDNFEDVAGLDRDGFEPAIHREDINLFSDLYMNTARDVALYEKGVNFLANNKSRLDADNDGVLTLKEIYAAKVNPAFSSSDMQILDYLGDRYSNRLRYSNSTTDLSVLRADVPDEDFKPGGMKGIIDHNQSLVFEKNTHDKYSTLAWASPAIGAALGACLARFRFLGAAAFTAGGAGIGKLVFNPMARWGAQHERYSQEERIQRLMTTVGDLKY